jgi:hypothetical protein
MGDNQRADPVHAFDSQLDARLLTPDEDRRALFAVRYHGYRDAGYDIPGDGQYSDAYDALPTTLVIGVYLARQPVGTMRVSFWSPPGREPALPCENVYASVADIKRRAEGRIVELSRMSVAPSLGEASRRTAVYAQLVRMGLMICFATDVAQTLVATHTKWRHFYQRIFGFSFVAGPGAYPPGNEPIELFALNFRKANKRLAMRNPFFRIVEADVDRLRRELEPWCRARAV